MAIGCGALNGFIVAKSKCMPLIITLGMSFVYRGLALIITTGRVLAFKLAFEPLRLLKIGNLVPITLLMFLGIVLISYIIINRTRFGRRLVAIGGNEQTARLSGISVDRYKIAIYAISGLYCAIALVIFASRLDSIKSTSGDDFNMWALVAPIIGGVTFDGGKGTIIGAFLGAFFMGIVQNAMGILNVSPYIQVMVNGIIIVVAVVLSNLENIRKR
jgi:ribose/xylose/arabinose/galactoside ABC-type transport system permease subunit